MMPLSVSTGYELRNAQVLDAVARRYIGPLVRVTDAGVNTTGDAGFASPAIFGELPLEIFVGKLHCKEIMQRDMRMLTPSGAWPEAFEMPANAI